MKTLAITVVLLTAIGTGLPARAGNAVEQATPAAYTARGTTPTAFVDADDWNFRLYVGPDQGYYYQPYGYYAPGYNYYVQPPNTYYYVYPAPRYYGYRPYNRYYYNWHSRDRDWDNWYRYRGDRDDWRHHRDRD